MPTFLWSGKDAEGHKRHERIDAENAQAAKALLLSRGWTNLELVKDALSYSEAVRVKVNREVDDEIAARFRTPEAEASFHNRSWKTSILGRSLDAAGKNWKLILLSIALIAWGTYMHRIFSLVIGIMGLAVGVLLMPVISITFRLLGTVKSDFRRLNDAKVWGRWEEVLEIVERLKKPDRMTGVMVPELELVKSRAVALAALGRLHEGLAEYSRLENSPKLERWIYLSFLASIYDAGQQFEKGYELRREVAELNPQSSMVWIDVAYSSVRRLNRTEEAREALVRAEQLELSGLSKKYLPFVKGIILWREHKLEEAREQLEQALEEFRELAGRPLIEGNVMIIKSFLCTSYFDLGNAPKAKRLFREVEPYLIAQRDEQMLEYCRGVGRMVTA